MALTQPQVFDARPGYERKPAPDTGIRQARSPVPAEHAVRLPEMRKTVHRVRRAAEEMLLLPRAYIAHGGSEGECDLILAGAKRVCDVQLPRPVHIVGVCDRLSVQHDIAQRVKSFASEQNMPGFQKRLRRCKHAAKGEIFLHAPQGRKFVLPIIRVLHKAGI